MSVKLQKPFDLQANTICQGFVFLQMKTSKLLMVRPGEWIDSKAYKKLQGLHNSIVIESVVDNEIKENFKTLLHNHLKSKLVSEVKRSSEELLKFFHQQIISGTSFNCWAQSCFEVISKASQEQMTRMYEVDIKLLQKAYLSGAIAVWISLVNDYTEPSFIEDIYHLAFFQDIGLISNNYSYFVKEAIHKEQERSGSGLSYLMQMKASTDEISVFESHPQKSLELLAEAQLLHNKSLVQSLLLQHEQVSGDGLLGYSEEVMSTWEEILILSDKLIPLRSLDEFDLLNELNSFKDHQDIKSPIQKVKKKVLSFFTHIPEKESA